MIPRPPPEAAQLNLKPFLPWEAITLVPELALSVCCRAQQRQPMP